MQQIRFLALDEQDLDVVSAHVQDAVVKVGDIVWLPAEKRLVIALNRFVWEKKRRWFSREYERRRAVLHFDRVLGVRSSAIDRTDGDTVLALLALQFQPSDMPAGTIEMTFAGGATMRLDVECIEARLSDTGGAWQTHSIPRHDH